MTTICVNRCVCLRVDFPPSSHTHYSSQERRDPQNFLYPPPIRNQTVPQPSNLFPLPHRFHDCHGHVNRHRKYYLYCTFAHIIYTVCTIGNEKWINNNYINNKYTIQVPRQIIEMFFFSSESSKNYLSPSHVQNYWENAVTVSIDQSRLSPGELLGTIGCDNTTVLIYVVTSDNSYISLQQVINVTSGVTKHTTLRGIVLFFISKVIG